MPQLIFSNALTANQVGYNPASGWAYEFLPWPAHIFILMRGTHAAGKMLATVYTGSETIVERCPVANGGTANNTPTEYQVPPISFQAAAGDRLKILIDETGGATPTVDGVLIANPLF